MAEQEIDITIKADGNVEIDMIDYKGSACEVDMKKLAKQIGVVMSSQKKQDYYQDDKKVRITE